MEKRYIPKFETEAEEAQWLYDHREELSQDFVAASRDGRLGQGIKVRWAERLKRDEQAEAARQTSPEKSSRAA